MREYFRATAWARVRTSMVLPSPGTPSSSTWPPASSAISTPSTTSPCPTMTLEIWRRTSTIFSASDSTCAAAGAPFSWFCIIPILFPVDRCARRSGRAGGRAHFLLLRLGLRFGRAGVIEVLLHVHAVALRNVLLLGPVGGGHRV